LDRLAPKLSIFELRNIVAIHPIRITGDPVLHRAAQTVSAFDNSLAELVSDMVDTMRAAPGVGLAAPQIGVPLRVFVWEWEDEEGALHEGVVLNPRLRLETPPPRSLDPLEDLEGCLSVPDARYPLARSSRVTLSGVRLDGSDLEISAEGWLARIFQHEFDHLQGVLYVDRLAWKHRRAARKEIRARDWGKPGRQWLPGVDDFEGSGEDAEHA